MDAFAVGEKECESKTAGIGVFRITIHNELSVARTVLIDTEAWAIGTTENFAKGSYAIIEVQPNSTTTAIICKPFFGESFDEYQGNGPELLSLPTTVSINDGSGFGITEKFFHKGYIPGTLFVDIPDFEYTITR
jgi:hypothetical protein